MNFARTTRRTKKSGDQRTREAIGRRMMILLDIAASDIRVEDDDGSFCVFCEVDVPEEEHDPERVHLPACVYRRAIRERDAARRLVAEVRGNEEKTDVRRTG